MLLRKHREVASMGGRYEVVSSLVLLCERTSMASMGARSEVVLFFVLLFVSKAIWQTSDWEFVQIQIFAEMVRRMLRTHPCTGEPQVCAWRPNLGQK